METREPHHVHPPAWILVFCRESKSRWIRLLACGRYKHVRAYAFVPALRAWLFYDVTLSNTLVMALPDGSEAEAYLCEFTRGADLVSMAPRPWKGWRFSPFSCVSAVKQLIGLPSGALRPDALYRDCLAAGGVPLGT
jgi:hypothetical protein